MAESQAERELDRLAGLARAAEPPALAPFETRRLVRDAVLAAERKRRTKRRATWAALAVASVLALAYVVGGKNATRLAVAADDNPLRVTLSSGDVVLAMPDSELVVTDDRPALRRVELERGSALFNVAKLGAAQQFEVRAGAVRVRVLGTVFSVEHGARGVFVRAYEGRVSVDGAELVAPASWSARRLPPTASPVMVAEAARFMAERSVAHTVSPFAPPRSVAAEVSSRTPDVSPGPNAEPAAAAEPARPDTTWSDEARARALLRAGRVQQALALSAPVARVYDAAASVSADALRRLGRGCEAAAHYSWLAERPGSFGDDDRARLWHANLVLSAAQLRFHACADAAGSRALLEQHDACAHDALLRERATALLVDILVSQQRHVEAAAWARTYLDRESASATSARMRRIAAQSP